MGRTLRVRTDGRLPAYAHEGDAGLDLRAACLCEIPPHSSELVPTGLQVEIPTGCMGLMAPRSGLGSSGITMRNAVGIIDSGFRGELKVPLWNTTDEPFLVSPGYRIAQLVILPFVPCSVERADELSDSERGADGYGSTGVR